MTNMLLAALILLARLIAPATAAPSLADPAASIDRIVLQSLCHGASSDHPAPAHSPSEHECLLCPACDLLSQAALPTPVGHPSLMPARAPRALGAYVPAGTGPPSRPRAATPPTGPPLLLA